MRRVVRVGAFVRKEIIQVVRQPGLVVSLVLGPFAILLLFGAGLRDDDPAVETIFVVPENSRLAEEVEQFAAAQSERLTVVSVQQDAEDAIRRLRQGEVRMVLAFPEDAEQIIRSGRQAEVDVFHNQIDPLETQAVALFTRTGVDEINQQVLRELVRTGQRESVDIDRRLEVAQRSVAALEDELSTRNEDAAGRQLRLAQSDLTALALALGPTLGVLSGIEDVLGPGQSEALVRLYESLTEQTDQLAALEQASAVDRQEVAQLSSELEELERELETFRRLEPTVIVSPFDGTVQRLVEGDVQLVDFYAPAVVALLVQHLVVTFVGLSLVRERELGTNELFRAAPVTSWEILVGKYIAFFLLGALISGLLVLTLVAGLGVPMVGSWPVVVTVLVLLLIASTGLGFVLALLAETDSQAVQYAMLVLLASIFFSGFLLSLERFRTAVTWVAQILPVTHGVVLLRDEMLRGQLISAVGIPILVVLAVVLFVSSWQLLRRRLYRG